LPETQATLTAAGDGARPVSVGDAPDRLERGQRVDRYVVVDKLGQGGMGAVYKAYDPKLDRGIAIKIVQVQADGSRDGSHRQSRLLREAQALAQLSHPNVLGIYDVGTYEDDIFLALELVEGDTLGDWVRDGGRSWRDIVEAYAAAGRGLGAAHSAGIVHRDFKPSNVLRGDDGRVRVLDFGLARAAGESSSRDPMLDSLDATGDDLSMSTSGETAGHALDAPMTQAGRLMGTPRYMSPEQFAGTEIDARSDQFGFCAALYNALYRQKPFHGRTLGELEASVRAGKVKPPARSGVPARLGRIVTRGLAAAPEARYASMDELVRELEAVLGRPRRLVALAAASAVAILVAVGFAVAGGGDQRDPCADASVGLEPLWSDDIRGGVESAFAGVGRAHAAASFARVDRQIGAFSGAWDTASEAVCRETYVNKRQSEALFDLRMRCLLRKRSQMASLVQVYREDINADVVDNAVSALAGVTDLTECNDVERLTAAATDAPDPAIADQVNRELEILDRVEALFRAGRIELGRQMVDEVHKRADALGYPRLSARAFWLQGRLLQEAGEFVPARDALLAAAEAASEARDLVTLTAVWSELMWVVSFRLGEPDVGLAYRGPARSALVMAGSPPPEEAHFHLRLGTAFLGRGDQAKAIEHYRHAVGIYEDLPEHAFTHGLAHSNLGTALQRQGDSAGARHHTRRSLEIWQEVLGDEHVRLATVQNNLGVAAEKERRYGEAQQHYRRAIAIYLANYGPEHLGTFEVRHNLGVVLTFLGDYAAAESELVAARDAFEKALGSEHVAIAIASKNIGRLFVTSGDLERASRALERARAILTSRPGQSVLRLGEVDYLEGTLEQARGNHRAALALFERAEASTSEGGGKEHVQNADILTARGVSLRATGRAADAVVALERALAVHEAANSSELRRANTRFELAAALSAARRAARRAAALADAAEASYREAGEDWTAPKLEAIAAWRAATPTSPSE